VARKHGVARKRVNRTNSSMEEHEARQDSPLPALSQKAAFAELLGAYNVGEDDEALHLVPLLLRAGGERAREHLPNATKASNQPSPQANTHTWG
jgi:hypothetical protein